MAESGAFSWLCAELERTSGFSRLEARGTVRLTLKQAGLRAEDLTPTQAASVVEKLLPGELAARGVADAELLCRGLAHAVAVLRDERSGIAPDEVFRQLART
ncbi:MAG: hypothetical protein CL819_09835 [Croceicoccus sp.]|nr:hypothetical protein [Croceicoccus sp.]